DVCVVDEAHKLKNEKTQLARAFKHVRTKRRIALTGTPVQNNLHECFVMVDWVRPNALGTAKEFKQNFTDAIEKGQMNDSSKVEVSKMRKRAYILHSKLNEFVHRKGYAVLRQGLPPKKEFVVTVNLSPLQKRLYRAYCQVNPPSP
ncbi:SNF2 family N-terminal domain-containing protein, partial [Pavlovales sp. CCMP2436]